MLNGQVLADGEKLVIIEGAMLFPSQVLLDAIGAQAQYLPNEQQKLVITRGNDTINLWMGSVLGTVNGTPMAVEVSPTLAGSTMYVPLAFIVKSFGGSINYDEVNSIVYLGITPIGGQGGTVQPPGTLQMQAVVLQVYPGAAYSLLVRNTATNATQLVPLAPQCQILKGAAGQTPSPAQAADINAGDQVDLTVLNDQAVRVLITVAGSGQGGGQQPQLQHMRVEIAGVTGRYLLLPSGASLLVADNAGILDQNGRAMALQALRPNDRVLLIIDTANNFVVRIVREVTGGATTADNTPPRFTATSPKPNSTINESSPALETRFTDAGSGINRAATTMVFDGQDVTAQCDIQDDRVRYTAVDLTDGPHSADVTITDKAGNANRNQWSFTVQAPTGKEILSITHNADVPLAVGQTLEVTVRVARPGGKMKFDIGTWKLGLLMDRVGDTNVYLGRYEIQPGDEVTAKLKVLYRPPQGDWITDYSETDAHINATAAAQLAVTQPHDGDVVGKEMVVAGTGPAECRVRVNVRFNKQRFFDLSHDLTQQIVTIAADGTWQTDPYEMEEGLFGKADTYDIKAELLAKDAEDTADPISTVTLTVKGK